MVMWSVLPRDKALGRNFDPVTRWTTLTIVERHNVLGAVAGSWSVEAPTANLTDLLVPGGGVRLYRGDDEIMSGPSTELAVGDVTSTISGISDTESVLGGRILYPVPSSPFSNQKASAYDNRSGAAEDVLLAYVAANTGAGAAPGRQIPALRLPASLHRGNSQTISGRLGTLGTTAFDLAESAGFHLDVLHREDNTGPYLEFTLAPVVDRSANVRFVAAGQFGPATIDSGWKYTLTRPTVTRALVAGGGQLTDRVFLERADTAAEALWGARIEALVDQRQTTDTAELTQSGDDALSDGSAPVAVSFTISDSYDVQYRRDWQIGDRVGVNLPGLDLTDIVREVTTTISAGSSDRTETIAAVVGSRDSSKYVTRDSKKVAAALRDLARLKAN